MEPELEIEEPELYECVRCGLPINSEPDTICNPCAADLEAEFLAEQEDGDEVDLSEEPS